MTRTPLLVRWRPCLSGSYASGVQQYRVQQSKFSVVALSSQPNPPGQVLSRDFLLALLRLLGRWGVWSLLQHPPLSEGGSAHFSSALLCSFILHDAVRWCSIVVSYSMIEYWILDPTVVRLSPTNSTLVLVPGTSTVPYDKRLFFV